MIALTQPMKNSKSSNLFLKVIEVHVEPLVSMNIGFIVPLYIAEFCLIMMLDTVIQLLVALARGITINELNKPWAIT